MRAERERGHLVSMLHRSWTLFAIWLFADLHSYFFRSADAVIAADLQADIGLDAEQLGLISSVFYLAFAPGAVPARSRP